MSKDDGRSKRVMIVEVVKPGWLKLPTYHWPLQRFVVCEAVDPGQLPEMLTRFMDVGDAFDFVKKNKLDHVGQSNLAQDGSLDYEEMPDFMVPITRSVLRELGFAVVEIVLIGKSGSPLPNSRQPSSRYWVISLRENRVVSVHPSLRHAYSEVSSAYEHRMRSRLENPSRPPVR